MISVFISVSVCLSAFMSCELATFASMRNTLGWMLKKLPKRSSIFPRLASASRDVVSPTAFLAVRPADALSAWVPINRIRAGLLDLPRSSAKQSPFRIAFSM